MPQKVAVVIPAYKAELNEFERISLAQVRKVLGHYPLIFFAPEGKTFPYFASTDGVVHFPQQFFQSTRTYSILCMSPQFYATFKDFDYILIYQLDAFVFHDALEEFCRLGYDYIGAPWSAWDPWFTGIRKHISCVGNGGFSLRKVKAHYDVTVTHSDLANQIFRLNHGEDTFFSLCGKRDDCDFKVAPIDVACKFSAEINPARVVKKNGGKLPFGCHAWFKYGADFYTPIFLKLGYDLRPLRDKMSNGGSEKNLRNGLQDLALQRLNRRLRRGQSLLRYLPQTHFDSIRMIRSPLTMLILARLLLEAPQLADAIYLYAEEERDLLIGDLTARRKPHLIIDWGGADDYLTIVAQSGLTYGKRVVSFQREYMTRCEELFRKLGK